MPKTIKTDKIIAIYIAKALITFTISICVLSFIFAEIMLKLDLPKSFYSVFSLIIFAITAFVTPFISVSSFKNNFFILSLISNVPLFVLLLTNLAFHKESFVLFIIKLCILIVLSLVVSFIKTNSKSYKVR